MAKDLKRRIVAEFSAKNRAKGVMAGFRRDMDTTGRALRRMAVGALAVAGIGGLGYMLKKTMESIDQIAKMSDELQISTEALTGLEHAAKISGTSIESLHKAMGIFVRRMGEAKYGVGEGVRGLKMLNLTSEEIIKMGTEKSFMLIAERISQAGSAAEQAGIAYNFFGRQGTQLLNMFQQGREGIEAMREEAERLGLTFTRFDAAQVEAANDALTRARAVLTGLFRQATIELSPYIEVLADKFVEVSTAGEGLGQNVTRVFEYMSIGAIKFAESLNEIPAALSRARAGMYDVASFWEKVAPLGMAVGLYKKIKGEKSSAEISAELKVRAEQQKQIAAQQISGVEKFFEGLRTKAQSRRATLEARAQQRAAAGLAPRAEEKQAAVIISAEQKKMRALERTVEQEIKLLGKLSEPRQHARMLVQYEAAALAEYAGNAQMAAYATEYFRGKLEDLEKAQKWGEVAKSMEQSFAGALERLSQDWRNYGEVVKQVLHEILMETMRIMAWRPAAQALAGWLGPALSGIGAGIAGAITGGAAGMPTAGTVTPQAGAMYARFQEGGIVTRPQLAMVGEVREAFVPLSGGRTIPVTIRGGGGVTVNFIDQRSGPVEDLNITAGQTYMMGDQRIVDVIIQRAQTDTGLRRAIKSVAR